MDFDEFSDDDLSSDKTYSVSRKRTTRRNLRGGGRRQSTKHRRLEDKQECVATESTTNSVLVQPLLDLLSYLAEDDDHDDEDVSFEYMIQDLLPDFIQARIRVQEQETVCDAYGKSIRRLTLFEESRLLANLTTGSGHRNTTGEALIARRLKLERDVDSLMLLPKPRVATIPNPQTLDALYSIKTTPYDNSFFSRIQGSYVENSPGIVACDWETRSPWMELMSDIRAHYTFSHPEDEQPVELEAPIKFGSLLPWHLDQIHDLLSRVFWAGINVRDSLDYKPERCTVIATYKRLVVGAAILSSPEEAYITYLSVKSGWDNSQIATTMLYHLIALNPWRDITLHVSTNNPAMILYNRFGFKAEGFIAGFYEDYVDQAARVSKNAFRLRLRQ